MVETNFLKLFFEQSCQHEPKVPRNDFFKTLIFLPLALSTISSNFKSILHWQKLT